MDIQAIWNAIQPDVLIIILAGATYAATSLYQWGIQRLPDNVRKQIDAIAQTTTKAIEQKYADGSPGSTVKKQEAMSMLSAICNTLKIPLDVQHASAAIEAAVYEINLLDQARKAIDRARVSQTQTTPMLPTVAPTKQSVPSSKLASG